MTKDSEPNGSKHSPDNVFRFLITNVSVIKIIPIYYFCDEYILLLKFIFAKMFSSVQNAGLVH
jgi:hypothetical protein